MISHIYNNNNNSAQSGSKRTKRRTDSKCMVRESVPYHHFFLDLMYICRHHRSDAYSSFVALVAIGGTYMGVPIFDPLGGMLVSGMILKSGADIMVNATQELMDKSIGKDELEQIEDMIATVKVCTHTRDFYL